MASSARTCAEETEESALDVLVSSETNTLFEIVELGNYLEDLLGVKVDVEMRDGLKEYLASVSHARY